MKQLKVAAAHLASRKGVLLVVATALAITAFLVDGTVQRVLGLSAVILGAVVLLSMSVRLSQTVAGVKRAERSATMRHAPRPERAKKEEVGDDRTASRLVTAVEMLRNAGISLTAIDPESVNETPAPNGPSPLVTVVVPCYNEEAFVGEALTSILGQTLADWECLVVDDASFDRSVPTIWAIAKQDPRFRVLRHRVNAGVAAARNTGLRAARGKYIAFLDADDLLLAESLIDRVVTLADNDGDSHVLGSYCGVRVMPQEVTLDDLPDRLRFDGEIVDFVTADGECPFNAHAPLLRTDVLRSLGGFDESMRYGAEDWDLWYRAMRTGYIFVPSRFTTAVYRQKRQSMVRSMPHAHVAEANRLIAAAHQEVDQTILVSPTPTPLTRPLGHYRALLQRSDRAIRFAAMALVAGDEAAARDSLTVLSEVPLELVERHLDPPRLAHRGFMRALAVSSRELHSMEQLTEPLLDGLVSIIKEIGSTYEPESVVANQAPRVTALLVPQQAGEIHSLLETARSQGIAEDDIGILHVEREGGSQGVELEALDALPVWTLNQWTLSGGVSDTVFVSSVRTGVADSIARVVHGAGAHLVEVPQPNSTLMALDEARRSMTSSGVQLIGPGPDDEPTGWWAVEEYPDTVADTVALNGFKDVHKGERVVIIGNGPSLNLLDLTRLKTEYTIAVNGIFYAAEQMGFDPSYYVVEDTAVMRDNLEQIKVYEAGHKFFPSIYRKMIGERPNVTYFMMNRGFYEPASPNYCIPRFSTDPRQCLYSGQSVTLINLQLAYHLGFTEVILIGMDFSYTVPDDAVVEGDIITSRSGDPNHFHPDYFGPGKVWKDPKLDRVLANYALAKQVFEVDGRRILNATPGGRLELFERVSYEALFV